MSVSDDLRFSMSLDQKRKTLSQVEIVNAHITSFDVGSNLKADEEIRIEDVIFSRCQIGPGRFEIGAGVSLSRVVFDNVSSPASLVISSDALLDRVVLRGKPKNGGLWLRPDEVFDAIRSEQYRKTAANHAMKTQLMLDIADYEADHIEVLGIPIEKVKFDESKHVVVRKEMGDGVDWATLGIPPSSFWRICLLRLHTFEVDVGIFGLPLGVVQRQDAVEEIRRLRAVKNSPT